MTGKNITNPIRRVPRWAWLSLAVIGLGLIVVNVAACASLGELVGQSDQAVADAFAKIDAERAYWSGELDKAIAAGDADRIAHVQQQLSDLNSAESAMYSAEKAIGEYVREDGTLDEGKAIREVSAYLPFPANLLVGIGAPIGLLAWREWANRRVINERTRIASEIVESIEDGRAANPSLADEMSKSKASILASQSAETRRFVKKARKGVGNG